MIFLVQFGINKHLQIFQRPQSALALRARALLLRSLKNLLVLIYSKLHSKSCDYLYKLHSVNIQDDKSWAFSETVQNISKITYTASRFSFLTSAKFQRTLIVTLQHNKEFIMLNFLFKGFITINFKKNKLEPAVI